MIRRLAALLAVVVAACTEVATDPNAVVAVRFDGSAYPSIVAGDSLRDSLGNIQPLQAVGLNYKSEPVEGAAFVFSSPDTILRLFNDGVVFARGRKADATPTRVFATVGSLQSQADSLFVVARADSMRVEKAVDTIPLTPVGGTTPDTLRYTLFGDTLAAAPKAPIPNWLVSFQLRYRGALLSPTDTSVAYVYFPTNTAVPRRALAFVDTSDASGGVGRRVFVRSIPAAVAEDTIYLVATMRTRKLDALPISKETMIVIRRE